MIMIDNVSITQPNCPIDQVSKGSLSGQALVNLSSIKHYPQIETINSDSRMAQVILLILGFTGLIFTALMLGLMVSGNLTSLLGPLIAASPLALTAFTVSCAALAVGCLGTFLGLRCKENFLATHWVKIKKDKHRSEYEMRSGIAYIKDQLLSTTKNLDKYKKRLAKSEKILTSIKEENNELKLEIENLRRINIFAIREGEEPNPLLSSPESKEEDRKMDLSPRSLRDEKKDI